MANAVTRFFPPHLDREHSNIVNSENTVLFLVSCYQYILIAVVLCKGRPFRQPLSHNCKWIDQGLWVMLTLTVPFVTVAFMTTATVSYVLFDPAPWVTDVLELTFMSEHFRVFVLVLAMGNYVVSQASERLVFPRLARYVGALQVRIWPERQKKRKEYKVLLEGMRV